jgi:hypothetical protein
MHSGRVLSEGGRTEERVGIEESITETIIERL